MFSESSVSSLCALKTINTLNIKLTQAPPVTRNIAITTAMATIALPRPIPPHNAVDTTTITPPLSLESSTISEPSSQPERDSPVPNKHIPICPTGPAKPTADLATPPPSPKTSHAERQTSCLYPVDGFSRLPSRLDDAHVYQCDADTVYRALDYTSRQPLPDPSLVFPWLHGLHPDNSIQQTFFTSRRRALRGFPSCIRGVTIVKADGNLNISRLKGAIAPGEFLSPHPTPDFIDPDPREGFSVRNFQIQSAKLTLISDIIVYGDDLEEALSVAEDISAAQRRWREKRRGSRDELPEYNTFLCTSAFHEFEENYPHLVSVSSAGHLTGNVLNFLHQERKEMWTMTETSKISHNVFLGPTPELGSPQEREFDVLIECSDAGRMNPAALEYLVRNSDDQLRYRFHDFPSSGSILPPTWSNADADAILESCNWIYHLAHGTTPETPMEDADGDSVILSDDEDMPGQRPRRILIHCADGYTESSMLAIAYFSYSTGRPIADAWLKLHTAMVRNFFAYPADVALLKAISPRLLRESPVGANKSLQDITDMVNNEPPWFASLDGSFPSRVLDYLYLGNLCHANNPELLKALGVTQLLSVGEVAHWREGDLEAWGEDNVCIVEGVQDNGIDPLTNEFARCLEFIGTSFFTFYSRY